MENEGNEPLKHRVFREIKRRIISCEYPPGKFMNEDQICQQLNVSRTPVRDALGRLEQEGLVDIQPKKGFQIRCVSIGMVNDLFEVRTHIEPYVVEEYASKLSDEAYAGYMRLFSQDRACFSDQELFELDSRFHRMFIDLSGNGYFKQFHLITEDQTARFRVLSAKSGRLAATQQEHHAIASLCLRRDWKGAAEAMRHHIQMSKNSILEYVMQSHCEMSNIFSAQGGGDL